MGWKRPAPERHRLLQQHYVDSSTRGKYEALVVDMCSETRRVGSAPREESASRLCERIFRNLAKKCTRMMVLMFDCQDKMHESRSFLHLQRYPTLSAEGAAAAVARGKVIVDGRAFTPGSEPYPEEFVREVTADVPVVWTKMWASSAGKARAWELVREGIVVAVHKHAADTLECVVWHNGEPWVWPYDDAAARQQRAAELCNNTYGEGDQRVCEAAQVLAKWGTRSTLIQTIDTDMLIQVLCARAWHSQSVVDIQLKNELVDAVGMCKRFGPGWGERINAAFWLLASAGVDYCRGLGRFGYNTRELQENSLGCRSADGRVVTVCDTEIVVDTGLLTTALACIPRRNMKGMVVMDFAKEVGNILFCLALFCGASRKRMPCGGPKPVDVVCFEAAVHDSPFDASFLAAVASGDVECLCISHTDAN